MKKEQSITFSAGKISLKMWINFGDFLRKDMSENWAKSKKSLILLKTFLKTVLKTAFIVF